MLITQRFAFATATATATHNLAVGGYMIELRDGVEQGTTCHNGIWDNGIWAKAKNARPSQSWKCLRTLPQKHSFNPTVLLVDLVTIVVASTEKSGTNVSLVSLVDAADDRMGTIPHAVVEFDTDEQRGGLPLAVTLTAHGIAVVGAVYRYGVRHSERWIADIGDLSHWTKV